MEPASNEDVADVHTLSARIKRAARTQEARAVALLIKSAAPIAALSGRFDLLASWLKHLPEDVVERDPLLLYWSGTSILFDCPSEAHPRLQRAFELLCEQPVGGATLLAWAGLVDAIFFMYRDLRELDALFDWMTQEREQIVDRLPRPMRSLVVSSALYALVFRSPNHPRMVVWRDRAERLVEINPTSDLGARLTSGLIIDYTWRGNLAAAEITSKRFEARASRIALSPMPSILRHVNESTLRLHQGRLAECLAAAQAGLAESARRGVRIWDSIMHCHMVAASLSRGALEESSQHLAAIEQLFADGIPIDEAYYRAMLAEYGFASGDHVGALSRCTGALEVTDAKGVPYFMAVCRIMNGLALFESGHRDQGRMLLLEGIARGQAIDNPLLLWIGGLFEAHMEYALGNIASGDEALRKALQVGRDHALAHFFSWPRRIIAKLLDRALLLDATPDYLRHLIAIHGFAPGSAPTQSDRWAFPVRIYTFGEPRVVHADGRVEPLSGQFQRQIDLLSVLVGRMERPTPLHSVATEVYADEDVNVHASLKRVLHSLRERVGRIIVQRQSTLALEFESVWIDACSFQQVRREAVDAAQVEAWLDRHYHGHFLDRVTGSRIVDGLRIRLLGYAERAIRETLDANLSARNEVAVRRLEERWRQLFPRLFDLPKQ